MNNFLDVPRDPMHAAECKRCAAAGGPPVLHNSVVKLCIQEHVRSGSVSVCRLMQEDARLSQQQRATVEELICS